MLDRKGQGSSAGMPAPLIIALILGAVATILFILVGSGLLTTIGKVAIQQGVNLISTIGGLF